MLCNANCFVGVILVWRISWKFFDCCSVLHIAWL
jgi:hypothetical protein